MTDLEILALTRLIAAKAETAARAAILPGEYPVSFAVRVDGTLSVLEDTDKVPTVSIPWTAVVAAVLHRMGCTREGAISVLTEILPMVVGKDGFNTVLSEADVKAVGVQALASLKEALPKTPVKGAATFKGVVTPLAGDSE